MNLQGKVFPVIFTWFTGSIISLTGFVVSAGWFLDNEILKSIIPGLDPMMVNTSVCFFFAGIAVLSPGLTKGRTRLYLVSLPALALILVGMLTLMEYLFHKNIGFNEFLIRDRYNRTGFFDGHMTLSDALNFFLSGISLFYIHSSRMFHFRVAQVSALLTGFISWIVVVGYLYTTGQPCCIGPFSTKTLSSAALFFFLAIGIFTCYPERGIFSVLYGGGNGTKLAWPFFLASIGVPLIAGYLVVTGERAGVFNTASGLALTAIIDVIVPVTLIILSGRWLNMSEQLVKESHQALLKSEEHYRGLFDHMAEGYANHKMLFKDGKPYDYIYLDVNDAFKKMTGLTDVIGKRASDVVHNIQEDNVDIFERYSEVAGSSRQARFETFSPALKSWFSISIYTLGNDEFVTVMENVTKRKEADEAIRLNEEKLNLLFELLPVGVSFHDADSRIVQVNHALEKILSVSEDALLDGSHSGRNFINNNGLPVLQEEWPVMSAIREKIAVHDKEIGIMLENGKTRWVNVNAAPVSVANLGAVVVTTDITRQKQIEMDLDASQRDLRDTLTRLTEMEEDIRRKAAIELHDQVGQNLTALVINMNYVKSQLLAGTNPKLVNFLDDSIMILEDTIARTRDIMAELRPAVLEDYGLYAAIQWYATQFSDRTGTQVIVQGHDLVFSLPPRIEYAMFRIVQEAFTNIAKHSRALKARISLVESEQEVLLEIADDGVGFDPGLLTQKEKPTLGMTVMKERSKAAGGIFNITSSPGLGTTITVQITR